MLTPDGNDDDDYHHHSYNHPDVLDDIRQYYFEPGYLAYPRLSAFLVLLRRLLYRNFPPQGFDIGGTKPNAANVFGNPAYPGNTACGTVTNWIDEMVVRYNESYIYAYNFAISGATIDNSIVPAYSTSIKSVTEQVGQWISNLGSKPSYAPWTSSTAIFSFFIGINDI
ncbi:hypothetical protein FRC00_008903, partial [Tulasnella sp. 408]